MNKSVTYKGETIKNIVESTTRNNVTCMNKSVIYRGESVTCNALTIVRQVLTFKAILIIKAVAAFHMCVYSVSKCECTPCGVIQLLKMMHI